MDALYADELERWEKMGAVSVRFAFSRKPEQSEGCKHVQDRLYHDRRDAVELFDNGAKLFVCGSREVGEGVQKACVRIAKEAKEKKEGREVDENKVREWFEGLRNERFATDVFA
jgi:cytochrome P450 / NADPH-cytochrome P450 reductase